MFPFVRPLSERHYIQDGRVFCPQRGRDVDFDFCAGCERASDIQPDLEFPYVRCRPERAGFPPVLRLP
jgi:hypothetical protein